MGGRENLFRALMVDHVMSGDNTCTKEYRDKRLFFYHATSFVPQLSALTFREPNGDRCVLHPTAALRPVTSACDLPSSQQRNLLMARLHRDTYSLYDAAEPTKVAHTVVARNPPRAAPPGAALASRTTSAQSHTSSSAPLSLLLAPSASPQAPASNTASVFFYAPVENAQLVFQLAHQPLARGDQPIDIPIDSTVPPVRVVLAPYELSEVARVPIADVLHAAIH